ncbi:hypothetical protein F5B21DRAFT_191239 [Xylaria acuta]|nr:hypothetical protein F5B21DRAFT_191239 [Xylaria acuta]
MCQISWLRARSAWILWVRPPVRSDDFTCFAEYLASNCALDRMETAPGWRKRVENSKSATAIPTKIARQKPGVGEPEGVFCVIKECTTLRWKARVQRVLRS